jgi:two-component system, LytTR family, sensor kinase
LNDVQEETSPVRPVSRPSNNADGEPAKSTGPRYLGSGMLFLVLTMVGAVSSARHYFLQPSLELPLFLACIAYLYPWIALAPLVFRLEARLPLGAGGWVRNLALLALVSVPLCLVAAPVMLCVVVAVLFAFGAPLRTPPSVFSLFGFFPVAQAVFWSCVAGGYVLRTRFQLQEQERRAARLALEKSQLEAGLNQAQLDVLRARLNPHFLFNSLQNISVMTGEDPQTASRMLARLGDLLRTVLRGDSQPESTLRDELALTQAYVDLEQMRFGERLRVVFEVAPRAQLAMVPCFLLQPLIENAVVHGLRGVRKAGLITVSAAIRADELVLTVTDNGIGPPALNGTEMKLGVGLGSTCERLARMYPDRHTFSIGRPAEGGAEIRIAIPLRFAADEDRLYRDEQPAVADR